MQHDLILEHISRLRKQPGCEAAWIVLVPESNLGFEAQHYVSTVQKSQLKDWVVLTEDGSHGVGFRTTHETKEGGYRALEELLSSNGVHVAQRFVSASMAPDEALNMLVTQLHGFQVVVEPPKTAFARARRTFSGKVGGRQDDLVMALQLAVLGARIFMRKDKYSRFRM